MAPLFAVALLAALSVALGGSVHSGVDHYEYSRLMEPGWLYDTAKSTPGAFDAMERDIAKTTCSIFIDQRAVAKPGADRFDKLLEVPLGIALHANATYHAHINIHSRFLSTTTAEGSLVPRLLNSDLFVALTDGVKVVGFIRKTPQNNADKWGVGASAPYHAQQLKPQSVMASSKGTASCQGACHIEGAESFSVFLALGAKTSVVGRPRSEFSKNSAGGFEVAEDLRTGAPLSLVFYAGEWDDAFEIGAVEVSITKAEKYVGLGKFESAAEYVKQVDPRVYSNVWPSFSLRDEDGQEPSHAVFAKERQRQLNDGCGLDIGPLNVPATEGSAYSHLLHIPLVEEGTLSRDKEYLIRVHVAAESLSKTNNLLVGLSDGVTGGSNLVGFVRTDHSSTSLGMGMGGHLYTKNDGSFMHINDGQFEARESGQHGGLPHHFTVDIIVSTRKAITRVIATGANVQQSADVSLDHGQFGLDVSQTLFLSVLQDVRREEGSRLTLLAVNIDEVALGCDGMPLSGAKKDLCGICGGGNACVGCDGVANSGVELDACGVCGGNSDSCRDCNGVVNGPAEIDACGICGGASECLQNAAAEQHKRSVVGTADPTTSAAPAAGGRPTTDPNDPSFIFQVDCEGVLLVNGGNKFLDECGVCGGSNKCVGCDGMPHSGKTHDACGVCGGDNSTCCHNYLGVPDSYWDFFLIPVTIDDLIEQFQYTQDLLQWILKNLPAYEALAKMQTDLRIGDMAQFNRIFLEECLCEFCEKSGAFYTELVFANHEDARSREEMPFLDASRSVTWNGNGIVSDKPAARSQVVRSEPMAGLAQPYTSQLHRSS